MITEGIVAFSDLTETEVFNGQDTGKYSIVLNINDVEKEAMEELGVKVKEYQNRPQRKFVTKFPDFEVVDAEGDSIPKHIPYGSKVRILWEASKPHPSGGVAPYFKKIKVLEMATHDSGPADVGDEEF